MQITATSTFGKMDLISTNNAIESMSPFDKMDLVSTNNASYSDVDFWENGFNQHKQCNLHRCRLLGKWI